MGIISGIVVYVLIWWMVFFVALSVKINISDQVKKGNVASAPQNPKIGRRMLYTSLIALLLWAVAYFVDVLFH